MGDKVDYQHGGTADGKVFKATPTVPSTEFGVQSDAEARDGGSVPGSKQQQAPYFNPFHAS